MNKLYISTSQDAWRNLALDEYFLDNIGPEDAMLYFYVNANAVIIGRSQNPWAECNLPMMESDDVQLVRRISGGGAVYHDCGNLNFSFIMGERCYNLQKQLNLILNAVRALGIPCDFSGRNDLLASGRKFSGNAFCNRGFAKQHHGTLLLNANLEKLQNYLNVDPRKLQSKGTKSVKSRVCNLSEFVPEISCKSMLEQLKRAYIKVYGEYKEIFTEDLDEASIAPYYEKQRSTAWRLGKTPRFDIEIENRFDWGNVQLLLNLYHGTIKSLNVYTDANDAELAETIQTQLCGVDFGSAQIASALRKMHLQQMDDLADYILNLNL